MTADKPLVLKALDALNGLDRDAACDFLRQDLATSVAYGERFSSISQLAQTIGELPIQLEAARRYAHTPPPSLGRILFFCKALNLNGRSKDAAQIVANLPAPYQADAKLDYFRGVLASQAGRFSEAENHLNTALAKAPLMAEAWYGLATIKTATSDDTLKSMLAAERAIRATTPANHAQFLYALSKVYEDLGDTSRAQATLEQGATLMRGVVPAGAVDTFSRVADNMQAYSRQTLAALKPAQVESARVIFVHGLPRSGTTLVEQVLTSHPAVKDGAETNLMSAAFIPLGNFSLAEALAYQDRYSRQQDPFGALAETYLRMIAARFGNEGRIVDKSLQQSAYMPLLLHVFPNAPILWIRRRPEDCALSCYRTFFGEQLTWTYDVKAIASYFMAEDRIYHHLQALAPERILTVSYEAFVSDSHSAINDILVHAGLSPDPNVFAPHTQKRSVMTASVAQVRAPISQQRIGSASKYPDFASAFNAQYQALG